MGQVLDEINEVMTTWMEDQPIFFVASAPSDGGHVNVSPKGHDSFRVLGPLSVAYLDLTGSGAETIAHVRENGRLTVMFCAFQGPPRVLRLFGTGLSHQVGTARFDELVSRFPDLPGTRAIVELEIERIQSSCGYAVPFMELVEERPTLQQWARRKGPDGLAEYWSEKNRTSIDGLPALDV